MIEDESKTAVYLRQGLSEIGFVVQVCADGEDGFHQALTLDNDLIILDVMLPKRDGWSILSLLRQADKQTPALFLTARDQVHDRVHYGIGDFIPLMAVNGGTKSSTPRRINDTWVISVLAQRQCRSSRNAGIAIIAAVSCTALKLIRAVSNPNRSASPKR